MEAVVEQSERVASPMPRPPVSSETVGELVRQIEARHDLLQYEVDGWCVWPTLRFPVAMALLDLPFNKSRELFSLRELLFIAARDLPGLLFPRTSRYSVITFSSALMEVEGERYKDVFFDDLLRELGDFYKIENVNNKSFLQRSRAALIPRNVTTTAIDLVSSLLLPRFRKPTALKSVADKLSASLRQEPGLEAFTPQDIAARLEGFYWRKKIYAWLLGRTRARYLFTADGYSDHAIIAAAKERGLKVCEFQHGGFIKGGPEYGWPALYAARYKSKMPIPDKMFLYGDYWKEQLNDEFWEGRLFAVGNLRIDQYRRLKAELQSKRRDNIFRMVLTAQGVDTPKLVAFLSEFLKLVGEGLAVELYIKLHPVYETDKAVYESAFPGDKRVRVISGSEAPSTFELLSSADLHLSISSACHYDALGLSVPTVIIPLANCDWVLSLYRAGHAFLAETPQNLLEIVSELGQRGGVPDELGAYYFRPNALENMKSALAA